MFGYSSIIVRNDIEEMLREALPWETLDGKSFLITGANGMMSTYIIYLLMTLVRIRGINICVIALSRNRKKSEELFSDFLDDPHFKLLEQDVCDPITVDGPLDYIFHFAGNASPYFIKNDPVGILKSNLLGTINVLELSRIKSSQKLIFASTREVYGENNTEKLLDELSFGKLDCMAARSCYPESKRAAESLCMSYYLQYDVNFNSVRIAHTYGPGMKLYNDGRVLSDLISAVVEEKNIILNSKGDALRSFCYVTDAILGLMYILFYGDNASAFNLANEREEISIRNLAKLLITLSHNKMLHIEYNLNNINTSVYCDYKRVGLDTVRLESLGWKPRVLLNDGLKRVLCV